MNLSVLVDATNYVHTFWSVPSNQGRGVAANMLRDLVLQFVGKADQVCAVFDAGGRSFRHQVLPEYKSKRKPKDQGLLLEFDIAKSAVAKLGDKAKSYCSPGFEADDVVASLCCMKRSLGDRVLVISRDGDLDQLLEDKFVSRLKSASLRDGRWEFEYFTHESFVRKHGFDPKLLPDYQAIVGDSGDSFPGVPGLGDKAASELVKKYGTIDRIVAGANSDDLSAKKLEALRSYDWRKWVAFTRLRTDAEIMPTVLPENIEEALAEPALPF